MITHLILDSGPIIKQTPLTGLSTHYYTIPEVLKEIKDEKSKFYLNSLPMEIITKQPSKEAMLKVLEFAKKTGDVASLSTTDLKILALTLTLEIQENTENMDLLKLEPSQPINQFGKSTKSDSINSINLETTSLSIDVNVEDDVNVNVNAIEDKDILVEEKGQDQQQEEQEKDEGGWITPQNLKEKRNQDLFISNSSQDIQVACMTTDFAMQNLLLQMKMKLVSLDGSRIKKVKNWVLRCHACYKITKDMNKQFCPSCGNATLIRTSVGVDAEGKTIYYLKKNFNYNNRGTIYSVKASQGGKKSHDLILREDQKEYVKAKKEYARARDNLDLFDLDFIPMGDVSSKKLGKPLIGHGRHNVNHVKGKRR